MIRAALIFLGIVNAVLYASLLPLWEGFDEPFHYGYVQELSSGRGIPVLGRTLLPGEIWKSVQLAPASDSVKRNLPQVTTFHGYFLLPDAQRDALRARIDRLDRGGAPGGLNYEAQQAPLAYALLAPADRLWQGASLAERVWRLRIVCGILASAAAAVLLFRLGSLLGLPDRFQAVLVFVVLSSQMFYATAAHVANDWLAIPLMVLFFDRIVALYAAPGLRNALLLGFTLAAGLLTKTYFLALAPLAFGTIFCLAWRRRLAPRHAGMFTLAALGASGPWYIRNMLLYGTVAGMQQTNGGTNWSGLRDAVAHLPWLESARDLMYQSLWTGNNTFRTFSGHTLTLLLCGFAAAGVLYAASSLRQRPPAAECLLLTGCACYAAALAYDTALVFAFSHALTASPWYPQPILPVVLCLLFRGLARNSLAGRAVAAWLVCLSTYVTVATWWAKLIPLYAGYDERSTPLQLIGWYRGGMGRIAHVLAATSLGGGAFILAMAAVASVSTVTLAAIIVARVVRNDPELPRP